MLERTHKPSVRPKFAPPFQETVCGVVAEVVAREGPRRVPGAVHRQLQAAPGLRQGPPPPAHADGEEHPGGPEAQARVEELGAVVEELVVSLLPLYFLMMRKQVNDTSEITVVVT